MTDKYLRAGGLTPSDISSQKYAEYTEIVGADIIYNDLFHPNYYRHHRKLRQYDRIRLIHPAGDFDIYVTVRGVIAGGVTVDFHGGRPPRGVDPYKVAEEELAAALKVQVVPIDRDGKPVVFIQFLPKTDWRIIGLDNTEVARNIKSKTEAEVVMQNYLRDIRMRLPTDDELLAELKLREAITAKAAESKPAESKPADPKKDAA